MQFYKMLVHVCQCLGHITFHLTMVGLHFNYSVHCTTQLTDIKVFFPQPIQTYSSGQTWYANVKFTYLTQDDSGRYTCEISTGTTSLTFGIIQLIVNSSKVNTSTLCSVPLHLYIAPLLGCTEYRPHYMGKGPNIYIITFPVRAIEMSLKCMAN